MNYTLKEIADICGGVLSEGSDGTRRFSTVNSDSRLIKENSTLFAALKGDSFDGHSFVGRLAEVGGALIDNPDYLCPNVVLVPSVKKALYNLAQYHRERELKHLKVLAITGSVGKTTVKNMCGLIVPTTFQTYKSAGNRNSLTGLPMEVLNVPAFCTHAVLEAGMSDPGEIGQISDLIRPSAAIITNIGHSHILAFGSREGICREKLSITQGMEDICLTVPDGDLLIKHCATMPGVVICSLDDRGREAFADNIEETGFGTCFTACYAGKRTTVNIPTFGKHNVMNALLSFVAGVRLGVSEDKAAAALASFAAEGNRQAIRETRGIKVIADCYNASPESMAAALSVLKNSKGRRIAVLGDMLELGEHSETLHREVGKKTVDCTDILICIGDQSRYIAASAFGHGLPEVNIYNFAAEDYRDGAKLLLELLEPGDTVLFKASNRTNIRKVMEITAL